jgi:hypothetical protein
MSTNQVTAKAANNKKSTNSTNKKLSREKQSNTVMATKTNASKTKSVIAYGFFNSDVDNIGFRPYYKCTRAIIVELPNGKIIKHIDPKDTIVIPTDLVFMMSILPNIFRIMENEVGKRLDFATQAKPSNSHSVESVVAKFIFSHPLAIEYFKNKPDAAAKWQNLLKRSTLVKNNISEKDKQQ